MRKLLWLPLALAAALAGGAVARVQGTCGPFTDVTPAFCPYVLELYYLGITVGTSATTYSPDDPLTRGQAAVFVAKGLDQSLARSSRRAALGQWWTTTPHYDIGLGVTTVGAFPLGVACDGTDIWVANSGDGTVSRVRASDGRLLGTWTGADGAFGALVAIGRVFVTGSGGLYMLDPTLSPGAVSTVATLGSFSRGIAFDGARIWVTDGGGSVSIVAPGPTIPWSVTTVTAGFVDPIGAVYDGSNVWITDGNGGGSVGDLLKLDPNGAVVQRVAVEYVPAVPTYDGANIWVPNAASDSVSVVRASDGSVLATLTGNGVAVPQSAAFDGIRVLTTSINPSASAVSLWKAADLAPLGFRSTAAGTSPFGACSDGTNFWVTLRSSAQLARF